MPTQTDLWQDPATGIYHIRYQHRDARGRSHGRKASTYTTRRAAAETYRSQWVRAHDDAFKALTAVTVLDILEGYALDRERHGTHKTQQYVLTPLKAHLGHLPAEDLQGQPIEDYKFERSKTVKDSTIRRELNALHAAFVWAAHKGRGRLIPKDLVPDIVMPADTLHAERWFLNEVDEAEFLELALAYPNKKLGRFVMIGLSTGARREAILELTWDRLNVDARTIDFRVPGRVLPKTKRRVQIAMSKRAWEFFRQVPPAERVGKVVGASDITSIWEFFVKSLPGKFAWVTPHIMRHTFITLQLRAGVSEWDVAGQVGDTVKIIHAHYGHHAIDDRAQSLIDRRFDQ